MGKQAIAAQQGQRADRVPLSRPRPPSRHGATRRREPPFDFACFIDGQPPGAAHGVDVDAQGYGTVTEHRLYQLIRQPEPIADRTFEIEFLDPGIEALAFTFG